MSPGPAGALAAPPSGVAGLAPIVAALPGMPFRAFWGRDGGVRPNLHSLTACMMRHLDVRRGHARVSRGACVLAAPCAHKMVVAGTILVVGRASLISRLTKAGWPVYACCEGLRWHPGPTADDGDEYGQKLERLRIADLNELFTAAGARLTTTAQLGRIIKDSMAAAQAARIGGDNV